MTDQGSQAFRPNPMIWHGEEEATGVFVGGDDGLNLLGMPTSIARRERMALRADAAASPALKALLARIHGHLAAAETASVSLAEFGADDRALLADVLGDGEVSIIAGQDPLFEASEGALTGVWRVRATDATGAVVDDRVEVGDVPRLVREAARLYAGDMPRLPETPPHGVMNAPAVLAEIRARSLAWRPGVPNHVLNFTLLPMTPEDTAFLTTTLGQAPLTLVSGGYGVARVHLTRVANVWAVQYLNATGTVILDTVEIGDVPAAARAETIDLQDSAERLAELMEAYL